MNGGGSLTLPLKSQVTSNTTSNPTEIPPKVPPRKESISPQLAKSDLPIHLISTTNQVHTPSLVQQRIPTKLATSSKGKDKDKKTKKSHQRTNSAGQDKISTLSLNVPVQKESFKGSFQYFCIFLKKKKKKENHLFSTQKDFRKK